MFKTEYRDRLRLFLQQRKKNNLIISGVIKVVYHFMIYTNLRSFTDRLTRTKLTRVFLINIKIEIKFHNGHFDRMSKY